jgi:predicted Zn-dependent protease
MAMLGEVSGGEGAGPPEWLSTHPNPANREEAIEEMALEAEVAQDPALVRREEYLPFLEGMVFGDNPREGFFEGSRFFHPDMAFQIDFPPGWQTANSKQAVQAGSAEGDAVLALTLAQGSSPSSALGEFLGQEGMQAGQPSNQSVNGIPASGADFRVSTSDGVVQGRVVFLDHQGTLLRFLGFGSADAWPTRREAVLDALRSFRVLQDRTKLEVEPARIHLVTVPRDMDLETLLEREGASERADAVRIINRLSGNPVVPAGRVLKIPKGGVPPGSAP